ncbi:phosphoenolpyruvate phosphomutase / 2-hydroxyethylphosphonate cytidylyltransferase [Hollandina sp. SP2]
MSKVYLGMRGDIIHPGIINIINEGARRGELLIGLLTDAAIATHKRLPFLNYEQRKQVIEHIKGVFQVVPQEDWSYIPNLRKYKPDIIIHGDDWKSGLLKQERDAVFAVMHELGGTVVEIPYTPGVNASTLQTAMTELGTTPDVRLKMLKRLIENKPMVRIMEAHSALSGLIIEQLEIEKEGGIRSFDGIWSSSLTDSASKGKPDIEAVDLTARLQSLSDILECTTKPIIFDGDTGGKPEHFVFTVRTLERNGISAVIIEDKVGLKKNSLFGTEVVQELSAIPDFCDKISAGKRAQVTKDFMIIARLESLIAGRSLEDAFERAEAYVSAGADGIMIHSKETSGEDIKAFCVGFRAVYPHIPLVLVPTTYHQFTEKELASWGGTIIIYANHMLRASYPAMVQAAKRILIHERALEADALCMPIKAILELIPGGK